MQFQVADAERNRAKNPHELFIINLIAFHLLLAPAAIALGIGSWGLLLPVAFSGAVMGYIYVRTQRATRSDPWFVMAHWQIALRRCRLLLIGYAVSGGILLLAWLLGLSMNDNMRDIMFTALTRIGVMPTIILVFVAFVLESNALFQAARGEVPDAVVGRHPAPADLATAE
jgi:glucan phosphoethanolaminetransferase (alkaline phosphatase superfamily)